VRARLAGSPSAPESAEEAAVSEVVAHLRTRARVALAVAVLAPLLSALDLHVPGRPLLALAFFLLVPGVALAEAVRLPSELASWCLALSVSLAVNVLVVQAALLLDVWHPLAGQVLVALLAVALTAVAARSAGRRAVDLP